MSKRNASLHISMPSSSDDDDLNFIACGLKFFEELRIYLTLYKDVKDKLRKYRLNLSMDGGDLSSPDAFNVQYVKSPLVFNSDKYITQVHLRYHGHLIATFLQYDAENEICVTTHGILCMIIEAINNVTRTPKLV